MEIQYYGGNCITLTTKSASIVVDDNLHELGLKGVTKPESIALFTQLPDRQPQARLVIADPGEYEVSEVSIFGVAARAHTDEEGQASATIFKIQHDDLRVAVVGHIHPDLSEETMEEIGAVDILVLPVGGNGYTLDPIGAMQLMKNIEPKFVIPTHYDDNKIKYPVPQQPLSEALKGLGLEPNEAISKFKPKPADFSESTQLIILERQ